MNNKEFLAEVHKYIDSSYEEFEFYQGVAFEILCEFDRICRENQISYFLAYGTLLGAIRDHGLIPWDYDIDVQISFEDKEFFLEVLRTKLGKEYYYAYSDNVEKYPSYCIRIGKKGYHFNALHVDVFFLIGCPEEKREQERFIRKLNSFCNRKIGKYSAYWFGSNRSKTDKILNIIQKTKGGLISKRRLNTDEIKLTGYGSFSACKWCCSLGRDKKAFRKDWFDKIEEVEIRGRAFSIPSDYDNVLSCIYGEWKGYMSIQNRFEEFYEFLKIIQVRNATIHNSNEQ